jgi:hypothetical protein
VKRIQRQRTKGWRMPPNTVYVGRPSVWGNPWSERDARDWDIPASLRQQWVVAKYREELQHWGLMSDYGMYVTDRRWDEEDRAAQATGAKNMGEYAAIALKGLDLACWCPLDQPCHADVLLELAR